MYYYKLYGMELSSDLFFPQLPVLESVGSQPVIIRASQMPPEIRERKQGEYAFGQQKSWLHNRTAWILVEDGRKILYRLEENGNPSYLLSYILGYGMAMLTLQQGRLAIHCSALRKNGGAVLIAGESGSGKSTLTAELLKRGYALMADDMLVAEPRKGEPPMAYPAFPYQKLCRDAALSEGWDLEKLIYIDEDKDKFLVPYEGEFSLEPVPIRAMVILALTRESEPRRIPLAGMERFAAVAGNLFLRNLLGKEKFAPENGQRYLDFARETPVYVISRPAGKDTLSQVTRLVLECLEEEIESFP